MRPRYPLEPLERVRQQEVLERERTLAERVQKVRQATLARANQEARLAEERRHTQRALGEEQARLVSGCARAADLARKADFEVGARLREHREKAELEQARRNERGAEQAERDARIGLADAQAKQHALGRHRQRFDRALERASEAAAEDEALDLHNHRDPKRRS
jgi:hypothetical protein